MDNISSIIKNKITIAEAFDEFEEYNVFRDLSEYSIKFYRDCFNYFSDYYDVTQICRNIDFNTIKGYKLHMKDMKTINSITINTRLRGIRAFLYFCMNEERGYIQKFKIPIAKDEETVKVSYSDEELTRLLKKPNLKTCSFVEYRDWVLSNYFLATR